MPTRIDNFIPFHGRNVQQGSTSGVLTTTPTILRATAANKRFVVCGVGLFCSAGTPESIGFWDAGVNFFSFVPPSLNEWLIIPFGSYPYVSTTLGNDLLVSELNGIATQKCLWFGFEV